MRQRFIQSFSTSGTEQEALVNGLLGKPYICFIEDGQYIDWNTLSPTPPTPTDDRLIATYNVTTTGNTRIFGSPNIKPGTGSIVKIELEDGTEIQGGWYYSFSATGQQKIYVTLDTTTVIPAGKWLPASMFDECGKLINIYVPEGVSKIGSATFETCTGLTSVTLPSSVQQIVDGLNFAYCNRLQFVEIGSGITEIGSQAFIGCTNLTALTITATTPPIIGNNVLQAANNAYFYVPDEAVNDYKSAASWASYADRVKGISEKTQ